MTDDKLVSDKYRSRIVGQADASIENNEFNVRRRGQPKRIPVPIRFPNLSPIIEEFARRESGSKPKPKSKGA